MLKFCPMCGNENFYETQICDRCGFDLSAYQKNLEKIAAERINGNPPAKYVPTATEIFGLGYKAELRKDYPNAVKIYLSAVKLGSGAAIYRMARLFSAGLGVPKNILQALNLYQKAAELGYSEAMIESGLNYCDIKNFDKALELFDKAAENNNPRAFELLARYMKDDSTPAKKNWYLRRAAELGGTEPAHFQNRDEAFKRFFDANKKACVLPIKEKNLLFTKQIYSMANISAKLNRSLETVLEIFVRFYREKGEMDPVARGAYAYGLELLNRVADVGVGICAEYGYFSVDEDSLISHNARKLKDINGGRLSLIFYDIPEEIWRKYESRVRDRYYEILLNAHDKSENLPHMGTTGRIAIASAVTFMTGGLDFGIISNIVEVAAETAITGIGTLATGLAASSSKEELYKNSTTLLTYCLGLTEAVNTLRLRIFAMLGFGNMSSRQEKAKIILEDLKGGSFERQEIFTRLTDALSADPFNLEIYDTFLMRLGDEICELEQLAVFMSLRDELDELKQKVFIKRVTGRKISRTLSKKIFKGIDVVSALIKNGKPDLNELKNDYAILIDESIKLQLKIFGGNNIGRIFETYKALILALEREKKSPTRIAAFAHFGEPMQRFLIPEGVTEIGAYAFANCQNLQYVEFPATLRKIEAGAFFNCPLEFMNLPVGLNEISLHATNFWSVIYLPNSVEKISGNPNVKPGEARFSFDRDAMPLLDEYFSQSGRADLVSEFTANDAKKIYHCGETLNVSAGILKAGVFANKNIFGSDNFRIRAMFVSVIEARAFAESNLASIDFSDGYLRVIHSEAFANCQNLEKLIIPAGTEKLGAGLCKGCGNLKFLSIPDSVTHIGENILHNSPAVIYCTPKSFAAEYCRKNGLKWENGAKEIFNRGKKLVINSGSVEEMKKVILDYIAAAEMGNAAAAYEAGRCFINKLIVAEEDFVAAAELFERAAAWGNKSAMFELYKIYRDGGGNIAPNKVFAERWLILSGHRADEENALTETENMFIRGYQTILTIRAKLYEKYKDMKGVYFADNDEKSAKKIQNAIDAYADEARHEIVILIFDSTVFGSATDGFLVTNKKIYIHEQFSDRVVIPWQEVHSLSCVKRLFNVWHLSINDEHEIFLSSYEESEAARMNRLIDEIKNALN